MLTIRNICHGKPVIYFVGLSAKPDCAHLSSQTCTGNVIEEIIRGLPDVTSIKTNLVKNVPLDQRGKLRYPDSVEMEQGWKDLQNEINQMSPNLLVTLGLQVSFFVRTQMGVQPEKPWLPADFSSKTYLSQSKPYLLSVHHPSFVFVYRRKYVTNYVSSVIQSISSLVLR